MAKKKTQSADQSGESTTKGGYGLGLVETWRKRIDAGQKFRDNEKNRQGWDRFIDYYQGKYHIRGIQEGGPTINLVFGYIDTMKARLYMQNPKIAVNPRGSSYIQRANVLEPAINQLQDEINLKKEVDRVLMDAGLVGHGWLKFGYNGSFDSTAEGQDPALTAAAPDAPAPAADGGAENPSTDNPGSLEVSEFVRNEEIFCTYVAWDDVVFDRVAKDPPYDCGWIAHRIVKPLQAVKDSPLYTNTANLKANVTLKDSEKKNQDDISKDPDNEMVELWEIWDIVKKRLIVIALGHDKILRDAEWPYEMEGFPFSMLRFNRVPGKPYPLSDVAIIEPQVLERIKLRWTQVNHIKRWNRQAWIAKGAMEKVEIDKYTQGVDGALIEVNQGAVGPQTIPYAPMQAEIFQLDDLIQRDFDAVIGQNNVDRGGEAHTKTRTLGELQAQMQGTNSRANKRQDMLEDFLEEVARKLIALMKQFQDVKKYVRVTGKNPQELLQMLGPDVQLDGAGFHFSKDDIQGDYDVSCVQGSTVPLTKENRMKMCEQILGPLGQMMGITPGGPVARAIGKSILKDLEFVEIEAAFEAEEKAKKAMIAMAQQSGSMPGLIGPGGPAGPAGAPAPMMAPPPMGGGMPPLG